MLKSTCTLGIPAFQSDSGDSKGLWDLQKGWNPNDRDNDRKGRIEQPRKKKNKMKSSLTPDT